MRFALASAAIATLATVASAANFEIRVGNGSLTFNPPQVNATTGDTLQFIFYPKNHTVTQSTFKAPCQPMAGGADSNYQPVPVNATSSPSWTIMVNSTDPQWFYCKQTTYCLLPVFILDHFELTNLHCSHCQQGGMVFALNPTAEKSFAAFQATAKASAADGTPPASSNTTGTGTGTNAGTGTGAAATSSSTSNPNGAVATGGRAGGLLAVVGIAASILL
jgi:plastocyanin